MNEAPYRSRLASRVMAGFLPNARLRTRFMVLVAAAILSFGAISFFVLHAVVGSVHSSNAETLARLRAERVAGLVAPLLAAGDERGLRAALAAVAIGESEGGYFAVVASDGRVLASTIAGDLLPATPGARAGAAGGAVVDASGETLYEVASVPIPGRSAEGRTPDLLPNLLQAGVHLESVREELEPILRALALMVFAFLVLGLLGAHLAADPIVRPMERLAEALRAFDPEHPGPTEPLSIVAHGEVRDLARGFEAMTTRLRALDGEHHAYEERIIRAERLSTLGALAAGVAHEIGNPLAGIRNCLQAVAAEPGDLEQTREYARLMIDATDDIERTVRGLVDVARRSKPAPDVVDLPRLCRKLHLLLRQRFLEAGVRLDIQTASSLPRFVTDVGLLRQVLINLLLNACDASPRGETVTLRVSEGDAGLLFEVADRGSGIAPEIRDRIFEPFVTTKAAQGGTGLGLAMVRRLVRDLGGEVSFESEAAQGTRFVVSLPLAEESAEPGASILR